MKNWTITLLAAVCLFLLGLSLSKIESESVSSQPDSVVIIRTNSLNQPVSSFHPVIVKDQTVVKELYADLISIPHAPKGTYHCPFDNGVSYRLIFKQGVQVILEADAAATGCKMIKLSNGRLLWSAGKRGQQFWALMAQTLGLTTEQLRGVPSHK